MGFIDFIKRVISLEPPIEANSARPEAAEVVGMERGHTSLSSPALPNNRAPAIVKYPDVLSQPNIAEALRNPPSLAGGRLSQDTEGMFFGTYAVVLPPNDAESDWWACNLDSETLRRAKPARLIELLIDLSPEVSMAVFQYLRFCNPGYEFVAYRKNPRVPDQAATKACQTFIDQMKDKYGSFDVLVGRLYLAAFLRGAFLAEMVLDEQARLPIDFATPDPASIRFVRYKDPVLGWQNQLAQYQLGALVALNRPTIRYTPVDSLPGNPYGRPLVSPALFSTLFLLGLLHDLRRVVAQQGYPRLDLAIDLEAIRAMMPPGSENDPKLFKAWIDATISEIRRFYAKLQPDDAYVHTNAIEVKSPVGAMNGRALGGAQELISFVERMAMRALKSTPLLMGLSEGGSEANSNRQWEIHVAGIKALQHYCEATLENLFEVALRAQGIPGHVQFRFAELRAAELLRDAQTQTLVINNEMQKYLNGWISQDEAANAATGHDADKKEPRLYPTTEAFKGSMVTAASAGDPNAEPKDNQPNANPNTAEQGGDKKKKSKTDAKKADPEKEKSIQLEESPENPTFRRQVEQILGRLNGTH